jgi:hypothetical protein
MTAVWHIHAPGSIIVRAFLARAVLPGPPRQRGKESNMHHRTLLLAVTLSTVLLFPVQAQNQESSSKRPDREQCDAWVQQLANRADFLAKSGGIKKWYAERKGKSLFELQLEAVDFALAQPPQELVDRKQWENQLTALRKFREEFAKSEKPFDPKHRLQFEGK